MTTLTKSQKKVYGPGSDAKLIAEYGADARCYAEVRHDDECGNGHNSFAVTGSIYARGDSLRNPSAFGCLHDDIARLFPELSGAIRYHLMSTDEPMHYIANTLYWLGYCGYVDGKHNSPPNLEYARSTAVWPDMPASFLAPTELSFGTMDLRTARARLKELGAPVAAALIARKNMLMAEFRAAVESLGFVY